MAINFDQNQPIYLQIAKMISDAILAGDIPEGEAIPSVRNISVEHSLNPQTVLNATSLLINANILEKKRGVGIFVKEGARGILQTRELASFKGIEVPGLVSRAKLLGLTPEKTIDMIKSEFGE